ncbi:hypothetical protein [Actinocorallia longicatena]|uniref:DUF3040 family protein n=1 Tax=Actinocorallia longicatena TaxID=111803 RepID=A0ABP6QKP8_9ACTN
MALIPRWKPREQVDAPPRGLDDGHAGGWVPHGYGTPPMVEVQPDWVRLRPHSESEQDRRFADLMIPLRAVLIVLLWATSSRGRAAIAITAVLVLVLLLK